MRIINPGVKIDREWWVGKVVWCPDCGCEFELEHGDDVTVMDKRRASGDRVGMAAIVQCPNCNARIDVPGWVKSE